jgi:ABC-type spermidine/putrescine transport system permease subunit II
MTMDKRAKRIGMKRALIYASAIVLAALWFAPVWFSLTMADKSNSEYVKGSLWGLPHTFSLLHNMGQAWAGAGLGLGFINSVAYGVFGAALAVLVAAMASYGLVVLRPKRRLLWFVVIFSGSVLPPQLYLIPVYRMYNAVGLGDPVRDAGSAGLLQHDPGGTRWCRARRRRLRAADLPEHLHADVGIGAGGRIPVPVHGDLERPAVRARAEQQ